MALTKIRGNTQILAGTITNTEISASAAISTSKLADGANFLKRDGSVALTGNLNANNQRITDLAAPVNANDAVRKSDLDSVAVGLDVKPSVRVATTITDGNITLSGTQSIDGVSVVAGDRVLVKNQTNAAQNGIYVAAGGAWSRAQDADEDEEVTSGLFTFVEEGTVNADSGWVLSTNNPITVGTTGLSFTQFSGAGTYSALNVGTSGTGVFKQLNGGAFEFYKLNSANNVVTVTLDGGNDRINLDIGAGTITNSHINASAAIARTKLASGTPNHVVINDPSGVLASEAQLAVSRGGTGSGTALNNNRIMISSGGAIVENAALTGERALVTNASGLPAISATTATQIGYLSTVTSDVQTQLNAKQDEADIVTRETPSGVVDGANDEFTLASTPVAGSECVYLNGLLQEPGAGNDYTIAGATITFASAPQSGDRISVNYRK